MTLVAVAGDLTTTTSIALAASWPSSDDVIVVEADPGGGDLAAWFDLPVTPSLSTVVTRVVDGAWPEIERHTRIADNGLRLIPAPSRAAEASQAVAEAARVIVPALASLPSVLAVVDVGRLPLAPRSHPFVGPAPARVLVHRQSVQSPRAAAVRLQRLADSVRSLDGDIAGTVVAVVGATPFGLDEIAELLADEVGQVPVVGLPDDPLAAAVLAGRTGVSARRLARLPLMRAANGLAAAVSEQLSDSPGRRALR